MAAAEESSQFTLHCYLQTPFPLNHIQYHSSSFCIKANNGSLISPRAGKVSLSHQCDCLHSAFLCFFLPERLHRPHPSHYNTINPRTSQSDPLFSGFLRSAVTYLHRDGALVRPMVSTVCSGAAMNRHCWLWNGAEGKRRRKRNWAEMKMGLERVRASSKNLWPFFFSFQILILQQSIFSF